MIRVDRKPMTAEVRAKYEARVLGPGQHWLEENPPILSKSGDPPPRKKRLPDYLRAIREELADAFHERCAYTAMWLSHPGEVDHFVSLDEDRSRAYAHHP